MGKQSSRIANLSEDSINLDVTGHLHRLQEAEEGFSDQFSLQTKTNQQIESQAPLNTSQGIYQEPSKLIKPFEKRKFYPCPCNSYKELHPLHPMDCGVLEYALTGKTKKQVKQFPRETYCSSIRDRLGQPEYKILKRNCLIVGWIKQVPKGSSSSRESINSINRTEKSLNEIDEDLIHSPSLCDDRSEPASISDSEDLLDPPKRKVHNHSLSDGINGLSIEMPLELSQAEVNPPERMPVVSESIETEFWYLSLPLLEFDGANVKQPTSHSDRRQKFASMESNRTGEGYYIDPGQHLHPVSDRETYLQSQRDDLRGQKAKRRFDSEDSSLGTSLNSCHSDSSGYWEDKLELIDSRCSLLAPSGTRRSSTNLSKDKEELSASDLIERLAMLKREGKNRRIAARVKRFFDRRRQKWNRSAKFHESEGSDAEVTSSIAEAIIKGMSRVGFEGFREYLSERNVKV